MKAVNPYLNFNGNTEAAFNFYRSVFGGDFFMLIRFKDTPEGEKCSPADAEKIMHISLPIGNGNVLMATDALESMGHKLSAGNNSFISIHAESEAEADQLFKGLSEGGKVVVPLAKMSWGDLYGQLTDQFGIQWMINYREEQH